ncbi:MAG: hypothetical protein AAF125_04880, partial [Chloroflexota bacterium]
QLGAGAAIYRTPSDALPLAPALLSTLEVAWGLGALGLALGVLRGIQSIGRAIATFVLAFAVIHGTQQVLLTASDYERARFPFLFAVHLIMIPIPLIYLIRQHQRTRQTNGDN